MDVQSAADTCTYAQGLTIPNTNPTKTGYTFAGWQVRVLQVPKMSELDASTNGINRYAHMLYNNADYCFAYGSGTANIEGSEACTADAGLSDVALYEWKVGFSYGTVRGIARCSSSSGTYPQTGSPTNNNGYYCWCSPTGIAGPNSNSYEPIVYKSHSWVFASEEGKWCRSTCAGNCAYYVQSVSDFRQALFGLASN